MSKEESKNRLEKTRYIRQNMGDARVFKPNPDCAGRFLAHCDSGAAILVDEFYGTMCAKCMAEAKRIHFAALSKPAEVVKTWSERLHSQKWKSKRKGKE